MRPEGGGGISLPQERGRAEGKQRSMGVAIAHGGGGSVWGCMGGRLCAWGFALRIWLAHLGGQFCADTRVGVALTGQTAGRQGGGVRGRMRKRTYVDQQSYPVIPSHTQPDCGATGGLKG